MVKLKRMGFSIYKTMYVFYVFHNIQYPISCLISQFRILDGLETDNWTDAPFVMDPSCTVFHYAFTCFEGLKAYRQEDGTVRLFRPDMNMARLNRVSLRPTRMNICTDNALRVPLVLPFLCVSHACKMNRDFC